MTLNLELLKALCLTPGPPGGEAPIRDLVRKHLEGKVDSLEEDRIGNLIAIKKGRSSEHSVLVAAHMDELGFAITHIDDQGFARFHPLGGYDPKTLTAQRVIVHGKEDLIGVMGAKPIHLMSPEERNKAPKISDYFIDFGMSGERVRELIQVGDKATRERDLQWVGDCVSTKSLDNRISVYILIETLLSMQQPAYDFYAVFSVQEEVGLRGATAVSRAVNPTFGFGLDTTIANDLPSAQEYERVTTLGKGTAVKILDGSVITDSRMVRFMEQRAQAGDITWQREILPAGGTDTAAIQRSGDGAIVGCVSIPTRHIHSVVEMCHKDDILGSIALLTKCVEELDEFDFTW
ncbi:MAG: M42 family metallopeptidase [Bacteroidota bacterium]